MESLIPIFRMLHFVGLALLLGGTLCSIILVQAEKPSIAITKIAWNCIHLVAAPGLLLLLFTGIMQSSAMYWENFQGAAYMYVKVALVAVIFILMIADMRTQKRIIKNNPEPDTLVDMLKKRQAFAMIGSALVLLIMWLTSFRPF
jgi:hypothetical protein